MKRHCVHGVPVTEFCPKCDLCPHGIEWVEECWECKRDNAVGEEVHDMNIYEDWQEFAHYVDGVWVDLEELVKGEREVPAPTVHVEAAAPDPCLSAPVLPVRRVKVFPAPRREPMSLAEWRKGRDIMALELPRLPPKGSGALAITKGEFKRIPQADTGKRVFHFWCTDCDEYEEALGDRRCRCGRWRILVSTIVD